MIVVLLITIFLIGCVLLFFGLRGKLVDNHPLCRRCKYDLVGTTELPTNCPECGTELNKPRATRIGNRKRRRAVLAVGILILTSSLTTGGFLGWAQAKNFDWYPYKPLWMLYSELTNNVQPIPPRKTNLAQREIFRRLNGDKLSDRQINGLVEKALELQADQNITWDGYWGEIVEDAWYMGKVTEDQLHQYMKNAFANCMHLSTRSIIRQGENMFVDFGYEKHARSRRSGRFLMSTDFGTLQLDNIEILPSLFHSVGNNNRNKYRIRRRNYKVNAPTGKYSLNLKVEFNIAETNIDKSKFSSLNYKERLDFVEKNTILKWSDTINFPVEVVAADTQIIEVIDAPELNDAIRGALNVEKCSLKTNRIWFTPFIRANENRLPMSVAFNVFWRVDGKEWLVNKFVAVKSPFTYSNDNSSIYLRDFPLDATRVDVILRSSVELAEKYYACSRIWQGEIVIPNQRLIIFESKK